MCAWDGTPDIRTHLLTMAKHRAIDLVRAGYRESDGAQMWEQAKVQRVQHIDPALPGSDKTTFTTAVPEHIAQAMKNYQERVNREIFSGPGGTYGSIYDRARESMRTGSTEYFRAAPTQKSAPVPMRCGNYRTNERCAWHAGHKGDCLFVKEGTNGEEK